jgi:hypothetical protein
MSFNPHYKNAAILCGLMFLNFMIQAVNIRAIALVRWEFIALTDALICILNFTMIQKVANASTRVEQVWYTIGGTIGALSGVWLTLLWNSAAVVSH